MKKYFIPLFVLIFLISFSNEIQAQKKRIMLFDEYSDGTVFMKKRAKTSAKLNYDAANKNMMYLQNKEEMILTNNDQVDTIYISGRKFIPLGTRYLEFVQLKNTPLFIDWSITRKYRGNRGAYGQITQNKVETINTAHWTNDEYKKQSAEVVDLENSNKYQFYHNDALINCKNEKDLFKHFPDKKEALRAYIKEEKLNFRKVPDVIRMIEFCLQ